MTFFEELKRRGLVAQTTHEDKIQDLIDNQKIAFYIGFDATADSLHVGHFIQLILMKHMQMHGHKPIALLGTATSSHLCFFVSYHKSNGLSSLRVKKLWVICGTILVALL